VPVTVTANLRIEGISETILHRDVTITGVNPTVLDVVEQELQAGDIPYEVRKHRFRRIPLFDKGGMGRRF
jgi:hypothetical protein